MNYFIFTFFALAPSFIWLVFFLKKDKNPEKKEMILKVFILGGLMAVIAAFLQIKTISLQMQIANFFTFGIYGFIELFLIFLFYHFIIISFTEEFLKYLAVRYSVLKSSEFDEPVDCIIYMIVVALGFAAVENFVYLVRYEGIFPQLGVFSYALVFSGLRFAGATFLHALCSGVVGFFLALGILKIKQRRRLIIAGIIIATALHGFFNLFIIEMEKSSYFAIGPITIIIALAFFISYAFKKAKEIKSVCEIK